MEIAEEFSVGVQDPDVKIMIEDQDPGAGVAAADADVVQPAVVPQGEAWTSAPTGTDSPSSAAAWAWNCAPSTATSCSPSAPTTMIGCRGDEAGVEGLHPHRFRRTFAHRWLAAGSQEQDLMRLKLAALAELYESRLRSDIDRAFQAQVALSIRCAGARCGGALLARVYRTSAAPVIVPVVAGLSRPFRDAQAARLKAAGLNLDEIGARLGVSRATAHRMVRRALREYVARPHDEADSSPSGARPARPAGLAGARRPAVRGQRPVEW